MHTLISPTSTAIQLNQDEDGDEWFVQFTRQNSAQLPAPIAPSVVEATPETPLAPAKEKKKRRRKTKQEYAEQVPPPPKEKDKRKGGRPTLGADVKRKCVSTLVSPARYHELNARAKHLGMTVSELIRPLVDPVGAGKQRGARAAKQGFSVEERNLMRQVGGVIGNAQLLVKHAVTAGLHGEAQALNALIAEMQATLKPKKNG